MIKCLFITFCLSLGLVSLLHAGIDDDWFDPAFIEANSVNGGTGFITVPSPEVIPGGELSAAIHLYQMDLDYGLWNFIEIGFSANLRTFQQDTDIYKNELLYARMRLLSVEKEGIGLSIGVQGLGWNDLGFDSLGYIAKASLENMERYYVVAGAPLPFYPSLMVTAGYSSGVLPFYSALTVTPVTSNGSQPSNYFFNLSKVVFPGLLGMIEYDGFGTNVGARLLLSPRIKLDIDFIDNQSVYTSQPFADVLHDNISFGITYTEPWSMSLAYFKFNEKSDAAKSTQPKL